MAGTVFFSVGLIMDFRGLKQCCATKIVLFRLLFLWPRPLPSISQKLIAERLFEINYIRPDILQLTDICDIHFSFNFGSRYGSCSGSAAPINFGSTGYASTTLVLRIKIYKMDKNVFLN